MYLFCVEYKLGHMAIIMCRLTVTALYRYTHTVFGEIDVLVYSNTPTVEPLLQKLIGTNKPGLISKVLLYIYFRLQTLICTCSSRHI